MKIGIDISESGAVVPPVFAFQNEVEFVSKFAWELWLQSSRAGHTVHITSDSSTTRRATRQNSRHLNLALVCQATDGNHGTLLFDPGTSRLNRTRAMRAAICMASIFGYDFVCTAAEEDDLKLIRQYKAFCWIVRPKFKTAHEHYWAGTNSTVRTGRGIWESIVQSYDLQRSNTVSAKSA